MSTTLGDTVRKEQCLNRNNCYDDYKMETVMLNTNIYGRPYDDIRQKRILKEAMASLNVLLLSVLNFIIIKTSDVLFAELTLIKDKPKREIIISLVKQIGKERIKLNDKIIELADGLNEIVNDYMDSLHIASASVGNCHYLITCDDELTNKASQIEKFLINKGFNINIRSPSEFLKEMEGLI